MDSRNMLFDDDAYDIRKSIIIPKANSKFLLFAGEDIDHSGGFGDYVQSFTELEDAKIFAEERLCGQIQNCSMEWAHIAVIENNDVQYLIVWNKEVNAWVIQSTSTAF